MEFFQLTFKTEKIQKNEDERTKGEVWWKAKMAISTWLICKWIRYKLIKSRLKDRFEIVIKNGGGSILM